MTASLLQVLLLLTLLFSDFPSADVLGTEGLTLALSNHSGMATILVSMFRS